MRPIRNFRIGASLSNRIRIVTSDSNSNLEASQVPNLWLRLRLVLCLVLMLVGVTRDNGLSYVVNMEYKNTMWCNVQVDPTAASLCTDFCSFYHCTVSFSDVLTY